LNTEKTLVLEKEEFTEIEGRRWGEHPVNGRFFSCRRREIVA